MSRGLPWSLLLHVLVLTGVFVYGNTVQRDVIEPPRYIQARLVTPEVLDRETAPLEAPESEPEPAPPPAEPEPLPPKEVPEKRSDPVPEPEPEKPDPQPRREERREEAPPSEPRPSDAQEPGPLVSGPSVSGTDSNFPFAWYLSTVEGQIARNWRPRQMGTRVSCAVHFVIGRAGTVTQVTLVQGSGVGVYDREALRAVQATRLPPLPPQYGGNSLGVTFIFNLEPGM